jgi:hypothetical protein
MLARLLTCVRALLTCALSLALAGPVAADEILFLNGDRLTGKIVSADGGKLTIKTENAGDVTVDLAKVKTFSTDEPIVLKSGDTTLRSKVTGGADGTVQVWCRSSRSKAASLKLSRSRTWRRSTRRR